MVRHGVAIQPHAGLVKEGALAQAEPQQIPHRGLALLVLAAPEDVVGDAVGEGIDAADGVVPFPHRQVAVDLGHPALVQGIKLGIAARIKPGKIGVGHFGAHDVSVERGGFSRPAVVPSPGPAQGHPGVEQLPGDNLLRRAVGDGVVHPE